MHLKHLQMTKCYPHSKERQYTYSNQPLKLFFFVIFWEALQFEVAVPQLHNFHMGFTPINTCPTKNSSNKCLGYVALECHANF